MLNRREVPLVIGCREGTIGTEMAFNSHSRPRPPQAPAPSFSLLIENGRGALTVPSSPRGAGAGPFPIKASDYTSKWMALVFLEAPAAGGGCFFQDQMAQSAKLIRQYRPAINVPPKYPALATT